MRINFTLSSEEVHDLILGANYLERRLRNAASNATGAEREFLLSHARRLEAVAEMLIDASERKLGEVMNGSNETG
jgi:hypothetical protein